MRETNRRKQDLRYMICPGKRCLQRLSKGLGTKRLAFMCCLVGGLGIQEKTSLWYRTVGKSVFLKFAVKMFWFCALFLFLSL